MSQSMATMRFTLTSHQGFDEFMNLVIDEAVEVRLVSKTNDKEIRKPLGTICADHHALSNLSD
jgi:hypothetical protein